MSPPTDRAGVSAIVLAGGRSSRFGGDKLAASVGGSTLLDAAIAGVAAVADDIVVVLAPGDERTLRDVPAIRVTHDAAPFGGPLAGLLAGLEVVAQPLVIVAGGDMPTLRAEVLDLLIRTLGGTDDPFGAAILERRGRPEPLPAALRTGSATDGARVLLADGERSLRSLFDRLPTRLLDEATWRRLDPDGQTLRDVDELADLGQ
jgi:molybdenum cofactor guanylyltransferase